MRIVSVLFLFIVLGCSNEGTNKEFHDLEAPSLAYKVNPEENYSTEDNQVQEQKIIKTARLAFETQDVEATHKKIINLVAQQKGLVQHDNSGKDYNRIFKSLILRVPTENFQQLINGISEGVAYFDQRDISRQDVSEEFVDLEARLKAKRTLESRYLELLKKANNVKEMLEIEHELSNIREEIEAKQGRLQYLQSQVSMSTITVEFYKTTAETGVTESYGQKMKNAMQGGWNGISVFFLGILYLWPLFLLALTIFIVLRIFLQKKKKKH